MCVPGAHRRVTFLCREFCRANSAAPGRQGLAAYVNAAVLSTPTLCSNVYWTNFFVERESCQYCDKHCSRIQIYVCLRGAAAE
jgi:hypothetical protein